MLEVRSVLYVICSSGVMHKIRLNCNQKSANGHIEYTKLVSYVILLSNTYQVDIQEWNMY